MVSWATLQGVQRQTHFESSMIDDLESEEEFAMTGQGERAIGSDVSVG